ncbi:MAG TPA: T9SS type A sorting domain-containing protein, partial [Bacteroidia bacterium]|nr:T9SS type A sorting domain-containing protein [Bacteroidia bacterium]
NGTLTLGGHYTYTAGTFTAGTGTVIYAGSESQNVASVSYYGLSFTKTTASASINSPVSVAGNLVTTTGGEIFANADVTVGGNITIGTGTNLIENGVTINNGGNWTCTGLFTVNSGTINFNGSGSQSVTATTFNDVTVNKPAGSVVLTGDLIINSDLTVTSGTFDLGVHQASRSNTGGILTLASGTTLKVAGANNFPQNYVTGNLDPSSTVQYMGTVAQTVSNEVYGNIVFSNGGSSAKSLVANTDIAGDLTINTGATFNPGSSTTTLDGNFVINGTYTPGTSTLKLNGTSKTVTGNSTLHTLVVSGSYVVSSGTTNMSGDLIVQTGGSLNFGTNASSLDGDFTVNGSLTSNGVATFTGTRVQTLQIVNAIISASTGVINFNGTVAPILNSNTSPTFATVNINNTAGISPSVPWTVYFACNIAAGASFHGGSLTHTFYGNFINNGTVTSSGELRFVPTTPFSAAATIQLDGISFVSTGKVTFGGTSPITIVNTAPGLNIVAVTNTAAAGVTAPSGWTIDDELQIGNGATFHAGSGITHTIMRSISNNGTLDGQTSTVVFADTSAVINGLGTNNFYNLTIASTSDLVINSNISISKNFVVDGVFSSTGRNVRFNGTTTSTISGLAGSLTLDNLEQDKTASTTTLSIPVLVTGDLALTDGIIITSATNILTLADNAASTPGTSTSFVDGPMKKIGDDAFVFPLGNGAFWARLEISAPASTTDAFTSQYFAAAYTNTTAMAVSPTPVLNHVSTVEYWTCNRTNGASGVTVTLYWESTGRSVINSYPDLVVARWNGAAWENAGQLSINGTDPGDITSNTVNSFSPFTFGSLTVGNPLPIELVSFDAILNPENAVELNWATAVEIENDYFTIEKTSDGVNYETVLVVDGAGNSSQPLNYSCVDHSPYSGISYYRLKQTDMNGHSTYSNIETIEYAPAVDFTFDIYPNPGDGSSIQLAVNASANEQIGVVIYDASGKTCHSEQFTAGGDGLSYYRIMFPETLAPGVYLVVVSSSDAESVPASRKIIVK